MRPIKVYCTKCNDLYDYLPDGDDSEGPPFLTEYKRIEKKQFKPFGLCPVCRWPGAKMSKKTGSNRGGTSIFKGFPKTHEEVLRRAEVVRNLRRGVKYEKLD